MGVALYLLISGGTLYLGLSLLVLGAGVATLWPRVGRVLVWVGLAFVLLSAVPLHPAFYALLAVLVVGWLFSRNGTRRIQRATTIGLLVAAGAVSVESLVARRDAGPLSTRRHVFVLGDSLSAGLGGGREHTWPQILAAHRRLRVSNLARPGARLADALSQARSIPRGPATVLVELGGNDILGGTTAARFDADLRALLAAVVAEDRQVLMFELPLLPLQNAFGRIQRDACKHHGVALLPRSILAGAVALPGNASDGLHLTPRGHAWLARRLSELWVEA